MITHQTFQPQLPEEEFDTLFEKTPLAASNVAPDMNFNHLLLIERPIKQAQVRPEAYQRQHSLSAPIPPSPIKTAEYVTSYAQTQNQRKKVIELIQMMKRQPKANNQTEVKPEPVLVVDQKFKSFGGRKSSHQQPKLPQIFNQNGRNAPEIFIGGQLFAVPQTLSDADRQLLGLEKPQLSPSKFSLPKADVIKLKQSSLIVQSGVKITASEYIRSSPFAQNHTTKQVKSPTSMPLLNQQSLNSIKEQLEEYSVNESDLEWDQSQDSDQIMSFNNGLVDKLLHQIDLFEQYLKLAQIQGNYDVATYIAGKLGHIVPLNVPVTDQQLLDYRLSQPKQQSISMMQSEFGISQQSAPSRLGSAHSKQHKASLPAGMLTVSQSGLGSNHSKRSFLPSIMRAVVSPRSKLQVSNTSSFKSDLLTQLNKNPTMKMIGLKQETQQSIRKLRQELSVYKNDEVEEFENKIRGNEFKLAQLIEEIQFESGQLGMREKMFKVLVNQKIAKLESDPCYDLQIQEANLHDEVNKQLEIRDNLSQWQLQEEIVSLSMKVRAMTQITKKCKKLKIQKEMTKEQKVEIEQLTQLRDIAFDDIQQFVRERETVNWRNWEKKNKKGIEQLQQFEWHSDQFDQYLARQIQIKLVHFQKDTDTIEKAFDQINKDCQSNEEIRTHMVKFCMDKLGERKVLLWLKQPAAKRQLTVEVQSNQMRKYPTVEIETAGSPFFRSNKPHQSMQNRPAANGLLMPNNLVNKKATQMGVLNQMFIEDNNSEKTVNVNTQRPIAKAVSELISDDGVSKMELKAPSKWEKLMKAPVSIELNKQETLSRQSRMERLSHLFEESDEDGEQDMQLDSKAARVNINKFLNKVDSHLSAEKVLIDKIKKQK